MQEVRAALNAAGFKESRIQAMAMLDVDCKFVIVASCPPNISRSGLFVGVGPNSVRDFGIESVNPDKE